jgi:3-oxoacyl-[acyl-carrier protein] reductase
MSTDEEQKPSFVADFLAFLPPGLHPGMDALARGLAMGVTKRGGKLRLRVGDQNASIEACIQEGVASCIFVFVTDPQVPAVAVEKALQAGLQVYTLHRPLYKVSASILVPNFYQGTLLANRLAQAVRERVGDDRAGRIAVLGGPKILDDEELVLGCVDGLKRVGMNIQNDPFEDKYRNLTDLKGESLQILDVLMKDTYPFDGLVVFNDETLHDVIEYLEERNLVGAFPIVSRNGSKEAIEWVRKGWTTATMDYNLPELGMLAADLIGKKDNEYIMGPTGTVYDTVNVDDYVSWDVRAPLNVELHLAETTSAPSPSVIVAATTETTSNTGIVEKMSTQSLSGPVPTTATAFNMLSGRVIAVTGAGRGIGRSIVENCLERGAKVAALDLVIDKDSYLESFDGVTEDRLLVLVCDVTKEDDIIVSFQAIIKKFGKLHSLVNNAGVIVEKPLAETTAADFDKVVSVNLRGTFLACKHVVPIFQHQPENPPRIVNIASEIGHSGLAEYAAYTASKGGIYSLTRSLALELAPQVLVNNVAPGPTDTPMLQSEKNYPAWQRGEGIPMGRLGKPDDVAKGVCFLLGPDSKFMTGSTVDVNGGAVMY